jgi:hypothetical protein
MVLIKRLTHGPYGNPHHLYCTLDLQLEQGPIWVYRFIFEYIFAF